MLATLCFPLASRAGVGGLTGVGRALPACAQAEANMLAKNENKEYLPIEGLATFRQATVELLLGADSPVIKEVSHP